MEEGDGEELREVDESDRHPLGKADAAGTCESPTGDFCGGQSAGACWCDEECVNFGDCCADRAQICDCHPQSCQPTDCGAIQDGCGQVVQCADGCTAACTPANARFNGALGHRDIAVSGDVIGIFGTRELFVDRHNLETLATREIQTGSVAGDVVATPSGFAALTRPNFCAVRSLDPTGTLLSTGSGISGNDGPCFLTAGNGGFGVAGQLHHTIGSKPRLTRLGGTGQLVPGTATATVSQLRSAGTVAAFDPQSSRFAVAYVHHSTARSRILVALVSTTGFVLESDIRAVDLPLVGSGIRHLGFERAADRYGLSWIEDGRVGFITLGDDGRALRPPTQIAAEVSEFDMAMGGDLFGFSYSKKTMGQSDIFVAIADGDADICAPTIGIAVRPSQATDPQIAWTGDRFVVAYTDDIAAAGVNDTYLQTVCAP